MINEFLEDIRKQNTEKEIQEALNMFPLLAISTSQSTSSSY